MKLSGVKPNIINYSTLKNENIEYSKTNFPGNNEMYGIKEVSEDNDFESKLKRAMEQKDERALKEVCQSMEEIFLQMIYKQMKTAVPKSDFISKSFGEDIFDSMLDEELMKQASKANGIGLGDMMYKQLHATMKNTYIKKYE